MGNYCFDRSSNDDLRISISKTKKTDLATIKFYDGLNELIGRSSRISHDKNLDRLYFFEDSLGHRVNTSSGQILCQSKSEVDIIRPYAFGAYPLQKDDKGYYVNLIDKKDTGKVYHKARIVTKPGFNEGNNKKHPCYTDKKGVKKIMAETKKDEDIINTLINLLTTLEEPSEIKTVAETIKIARRSANE